MLIQWLKNNDQIVTACFDVHDGLCDLLVKQYSFLKRLIVTVAILSLFFVVFPSMRRSFGSLAEGMLLGILFLSPLAKIFPMKLLTLLMGMRREFGILMGCFSLVHGIAYFIDPTAFVLNIAPYLNQNFFAMQPLYYFGIYALLLTLVLFVTSNNISMRLLGGRKWKALHRSVYVLLVIMLLHILFLRNFRRGGIVTLGEWIQPVSIVVGYVFLKVLAWKNSLSFLQGVLIYFSERHMQYVAATTKNPNPITSTL